MCSVRPGRLGSGSARFCRWRVLQAPGSPDPHNVDSFLIVMPQIGYG